MEMTGEIRANARETKSSFADYWQYIKKQALPEIGRHLRTPVTSLRELFGHWSQMTENRKTETRLNKQIRHSFAKSLATADLDEVLGKDAKLIDSYLKTQKRSAAWDFRLYSLFTRQNPLMKIGTIIGAAYALGALVMPIAALAPIAVNVGYRIWHGVTANKVSRLEGQLEKSRMLKEAGMIVPGVYKVDDRTNTLEYHAKGGKAEVRAGMLSYFPVLHSGAPEFFVSGFDVCGKSFGEGRKIYMEGLEALVRGFITLADADKIETHFDHDPYAKRCAYILATILPDNDISDVIKLTEKLSREQVQAPASSDLRKAEATLSPRFSGYASEIIKNLKADATKAIVETLREVTGHQLLASLRGHVKINDLQTIANMPSQGHFINAARAHDLAIMLGSPHFGETLSFDQVLEVSKNMAGWGKQFVAIWENETVNQKLSFAEAKELAENFDDWGNAAFEIAKSFYADKLSFEQIKEVAAQDKFWGGTYKQLHREHPDIAAGLSHEQLKAISYARMTAFVAIRLMGDGGTDDPKAAWEMARAINKATTEILKETHKSRPAPELATGISRLAASHIKAVMAERELGANEAMKATMDAVEHVATTFNDKTWHILPVHMGVNGERFENIVGTANDNGWSRKQTLDEMGVKLADLRAGLVKAESRQWLLSSFAAELQTRIDSVASDNGCEKYEKDFTQTKERNRFKNEVLKYG